MAPDSNGGVRSSAAVDLELQTIVDRYLGTGLLEFGNRLPLEALQGTAFSDILRRAASFICDWTSCLGGFASCRPRLGGAIHVIDGSVVGFNVDQRELRVLLDSAPLKQTHDDELPRFLAVPDNGSPLQCAALPLCRSNGSSFALCLARRQAFSCAEQEMMICAMGTAGSVAGVLCDEREAACYAAIEAMGEAAKQLRQAEVAYDDSVERLNCLALAAGGIHSLAARRLANDWRDAVTLLQVAFQVASDTVLSRDQLHALAAASQAFTRPGMDQAVVDEQWKSLTKAGIDLNRPLRHSGAEGYDDDRP